MIDGLTLPATWSLADLQALEEKCVAFGMSDFDWSVVLSKRIVPTREYPGDMSLDEVKAADEANDRERERVRVDLLLRGAFMLDHIDDDPAPMLLVAPGMAKFMERDDEILFKVGRPIPRW